MTVTVQEAGLDIAREIASAGIPVFAAPPAPATKIGFRLPSRWQQVKADPARIDEWEPGWALCMVCGCGMDVIDVDIYAGGSLDRLEGIVPEIYGRAATPSGGVHLFIATLGVRSKNGLFTGVDIKAGGPDGKGRGFVFISPTVRPSKTNGQPATYSWI